ncbi:MAG TPA: conjugative transposon protein TraK [Puia sp.]|uniref:conjugative transposon protein TraK n=1 Tax=Puia sp. TaxID=2045100 RepID=UPI002BEF070C|nr:conjugative transposon protein TraK [Puia sp.]HVU95493.1 conjugative transposon protein TraK [Puia sp.]
MFPKTRNLETAFQQVRLFTLVLIAGSLLLCGFVVWQALRAIDRNQDRIYILESGKALVAMAGSRAENIPVEARDHIRTFHEAFFTLDPDEKVITAHLGKALYLADGSARRVYEGLKESGYYNGIIAGNISQELVIDSVVLDMRAYPIPFRCYATEKIIRPTSLVTRNLVTEGLLRNTARSDNDPHGFLIERWAILDNHDLKIESR